MDDSITVKERVNPMYFFSETIKNYRITFKKRAIQKKCTLDNKVAKVCCLYKH